MKNEKKKKKWPFAKTIRFGAFVLMIFFRICMVFFYRSSLQNSFVASN